VENSPETATKTVETPPQDASQPSEAKFHVTAEMKADPVSKKMFFYSKIFAALSLFFIGILTFQHLQRKNFYRKPPSKEEVVEQEKSFVYQMSQLHVILKNEQDLRLDLSIECTNKPACEFIKENPEKTRDAILPVLSAISPNSISDAEAKKSVRSKLAEALNTLPMNGKVIQVNFTDLSLEGIGN
jgi:flagellar basal body-associated protein FliL